MYFEEDGKLACTSKKTNACSGKKAISLERIISDLKTNKDFKLMYSRDREGHVKSVTISKKS